MLRDIKKIIDELFVKIHLRREMTRTEALVDVYNNFILGLMQKNPEVRLSCIKIKEIEDRIDSRMYALVAEKVKKS